MKRTTGRNNQVTTTSIAAPCISLVSVQEQGLLSEQPRLNRSITVDHIDAFVYKLKTAFPILWYTSCHLGRSSITLHYSVMSLDSPFWQTFKGVKLLSNRSVHGFSIQIGMHCHTSVSFISLDLLFG